MELFDRILIATDDERIFAHARGFGAEVVMSSKEAKNGTERLAEVVEKDPKLRNAKVIANIQGDEPLLPKEAISLILNQMYKDSEAAIGTAVVPISYEEALSPHVVKCVRDNKERALYFSRSLIPYTREGTLDYYLKHLGIYLYTPQFLLSHKNLSSTLLEESECLEQLRFLEHGYTITVATLPTGTKTIGVDTEEDIIQLERIYL
jgi:3-deoxy-manno-octulosonate cytidylyltransferase (CMP-KDO synthetase)